MNEPNENAPGAGVEIAPTAENAENSDLRTMTFADLQAACFHAMHKLESIPSIKTLTHVVRAYQRALEGQLAKIGKENALCCDALDDYWRTQPDLVAAVHAVMKDATTWRLALAKIAQLLGSESLFSELPAELETQLGMMVPVRFGEVSGQHVHLVCDADARRWAKEWLATIKEHPEIPLDEGTMVSWFANALMCGYDEHGRKARRDLEALRPQPEALA